MISNKKNAVNKHLENNIPHASLAPAFPVLRLPSLPIKFKQKDCFTLLIVRIENEKLQKHKTNNFFYLPCPNHLLQHEPQKLVQ